MTNKISSLIFYESFATQFQLLSIEDRGRLITAILNYAFHGQEPQDLSEILQMAFCSIRFTLDRDRAAYLEKCRTNAENGKRGGLPRKTFSYEKNERFSEKTEKPYNKDKDKDKNKNKYIYKDRDKDKDKNKDTQSDAPSPAAPPTPSLSEQEKESLWAMGVKKEYIEKRLARATEYASTHRQAVCDVLLRWWKEDEGSAQSLADFPTKSYDLEDFVAAALARSYQEVP